LFVVNERSIRLNGRMRDVGPSGVSAVDLWFTQDGQHWQKAEKSLAPRFPIVLDLREDGRFGITLVPHSGAGLCRQPPLLGEAPQVWVDVDTIRPVVKIKQVQFVVSEHARDVSIGWEAQDRNFGPRPIRLSYADKPQGPWQLIAETENSGSYLWHLPAQMPRDFYVRVEAIDTAGNIGVACTEQPVVPDLSRPGCEILSVEANRKR
jgi:hypothetical protein